MGDQFQIIHTNQLITVGITINSSGYTKYIHLCKLQSINCRAGFHGQFRGLQAPRPSWAVPAASRESRVPVIGDTGVSVVRNGEEVAYDGVCCGQDGVTYEEV